MVVRLLLGGHHDPKSAHPRLNHRDLTTHLRLVHNCHPTGQDGHVGGALWGAVRQCVRAVTAALDNGWRASRLGEKIALVSALDAFRFASR